VLAKPVRALIALKNVALYDIDLGHTQTAEHIELQVIIMNVMSGNWIFRIQYFERLLVVGVVCVTRMQGESVRELSRAAVLPSTRMVAGLRQQFYPCKYSKNWQKSHGGEAAIIRRVESARGVSRNESDPSGSATRASALTWRGVSPPYVG